MTLPFNAPEFPAVRAFHASRATTPSFPAPARHRAYLGQPLSSTGAWGPGSSNGGAFPQQYGGLPQQYHRILSSLARAVPRQQHIA